MPANWTSLPVEIWLRVANIVRSIGTEELANLCLASSHFLSIARPVLYSRLKLGTEAAAEPNESAEDTLTLLARDADLARSIEALTLDAQNTDVLEDPETPPNLVHIDALKSMTRLKRLTLDGDVFRPNNNDEITQFFEVLGDLPLQELRIFQGKYPACFYRIPADHFTRIKNLKNMELSVEYDESEYFSLACLRLFSGSVKTLTSLSLSGAYLESDDPEVSPLFTMHFPHLQALTLDSYGDEAHCPLGLGYFLSSHGQSLEKLVLGYTPNYDGGALVLQSDGVFNPDTLPKLRSFKGHCRNIEMMAKARMTCLTTTLTSLTVGSGGLQDPTQAIDDMLNAIEIGCAGHLNALTHLHFDLGDPRMNRNHSQSRWTPNELAKVPGYIQKWAEVCGPTLEVWDGAMPSIWSSPVEELGDWFSRFPKLQVLRMPSGDDEEGGVLAIARKCSALQGVWVSWLTPWVDVYWEIRRGPSSIAVVRCCEYDLD